METISNIATAARNSVFGETAATTQSGTEPPAGNAPGKGTPDAPHDPGNVPEQLLTEPGIEPPTDGPAGKGTAEAPFDPGNSPEQVQISGSTTDTTAKTELLPTSSTPASKIENPDPSNPSEMKSAVASNDAANTANTTTTTTTSTETEPEPKPKKTGTAKPGSHSALFGLGPKTEDGGGASGAIHPPKGSGELFGTIDEAGETMGKQAEMEKKGVDEDDTGGYVGLKKAAMEEEEKKRNNGGGGFGGGAFATAPESKQPEEEEREPRSREHKNSLGREISPGEMPDGTHRKSIVEGMPQGHSFGRKTTQNNSADKTTGGGGGGFRDRLKDKFRSKK